MTARQNERATHGADPEKHSPRFKGMSLLRETVDASAEQAAL